jgi:hypothetical protein
MNILLFILFIILICIIAYIIISLRYNIKKGGNINHTHNENNSHILKYSIVGSGEIKSHLGLDYSILRNLLNDYGFKECNFSEKVSVSFGVPNHKKGINVTAYNPNFYKQHSAIKNTLDKHSCFINKSELYKTIYNLIPIGIKYLPKSYTPEEFERIILRGNSDKNHSDKNSTINQNPAFLYILKKDRIGCQLGIKIIETKEDYFKEKKALQIHNNAIISEYISNPLTIEGKKFHLRIHFLLSVISGITRCYANDWYHILTAKKPYINSDWLNADIHLTGGHTTMQRYEFPDDLYKCGSITTEQINIIVKNLSECVHVVNMALSMSNVKNYEESDAGYCIYGVDIFITKDFHPYIIEINNIPGYGANGFGIRNNEQKEDEFKEKISKNMFLFELNNVILPHFGIKRPNIMGQLSEYISNGILSLFSTILTGNNKCILIPYLDATEPEIAYVKNMNFYASISFLRIIDDCNAQDIFLIQYSHDNSADVYGNPFEKRLYPKNSADVYGNDNYPKKLSNVIGYIGVNRHSFIKIAIIEEYQNRGIATAMIAQLLELYSARYSPNHILKINQYNKFLQKIAVKLHFVSIKLEDTIYQRKCKINDPILKKINNNKILTYKIIENAKSYFELDSFAPSNSQFVHFLYEVLTPNYNITKFSTGNKHNKNFTYQGAELKSSLKLNIVKNIAIFMKWAYNNDKEEFKNIFNISGSSKRTDAYGNGCSRDKIYQILNMETLKLFVSTIQDEYLSTNYIIMENYSPYLTDDKNIFRLRYFFIVYAQNNGIIKIFKFSEKLAISFLETDSNNLHTIYNFDKDFKNTKLDKYLDNIELDRYINIIVNSILKSKIELYGESNSGFLPITIDINFVKKEDNYIPNIYQIWNNSPIEKNEYMDEHFIKKYYHWVTHCIIYPHFGYPHTIMHPMLCKSISNIKEIDPKIIAAISLQFNHAQTNVNVLYREDKIETIQLNLENIQDYIIELKINDIKMDENILLHTIFIFMDILAAYYAPYMPQLIMSNNKKIHNIAYILQFYKSNIHKNFFIRKCRI